MQEPSKSTLTDAAMAVRDSRFLFDHHRRPALRPELQGPPTMRHLRRRLLPKTRARRDAVAVLVPRYGQGARLPGQQRAAPLRGDPTPVPSWWNGVGTVGSVARGTRLGGYRPPAQRRGTVEASYPRCLSPAIIWRSRGASMSLKCRGFIGRGDAQNQFVSKGHENFRPDRGRWFLAANDRAGGAGRRAEFCSSLSPHAYVRSPTATQCRVHTCNAGMRVEAGVRVGAPHASEGARRCMRHRALADESVCLTRDRVSERGGVQMRA